MKPTFHGGIKAFRQTAANLQQFVQHLRSGIQRTQKTTHDFWKADFRNELYIDATGRLRKRNKRWQEN